MIFLLILQLFTTKYSYYKIIFLRTKECLLKSFFIISIYIILYIAFGYLHWNILTLVYAIIEYLSNISKKRSHSQ